MLRWLRNWIAAEILDNKHRSEAVYRGIDTEESGIIALWFARDPEVAGLNPAPRDQESVGQRFISF
jgi:hypothetical protein